MRPPAELSSIAKSTFYMEMTMTMTMTMAMTIAMTMTMAMTVVNTGVQPCSRTSLVPGWRHAIHLIKSS